MCRGRWPVRCSWPGPPRTQRSGRWLRPGATWWWCPGRQAAATAAATVDAFIDTVGSGYVQLALDLGVAPDRIDTIADFAAIARYGVKGEGNAAGASAAVLAELAALIADGELEIPIAATFPLAEVRDAYRRLAQGHVQGKIVLLP